MKKVVEMVAGESGNLTLEIERRLDLHAGDPLVLIGGADFVLIKKTAWSDPVEKLNALATRTKDRFEHLGLTPDDVDDAIEWARGSS